MKVVLDGLAYFLNKGDLGKYTRGLVTSLDIKDQDEISIIKDREIVDFGNFTSNLKLRDLYINRIHNDYKAINDFINNIGADVYHCTNNGFSLQMEYKYNCKVVATIHNVIPDSYEDNYNSKYLEKYFYSMQSWDKLTDKIICPSSYVKNQLSSKLSINKDKISVINPVIDKNYVSQNTYMSKVYLKSKFNFAGEFLFFTGDLHKRKRLEEFLEIFYRISSRLNKLNFVIMCNINKGNFDYYTQIKSLVEVMGLKEKVIFITTFNKSDKLHFYNVAKAVIDFSLYDGLTISLLEAKNCGANIICSDLESYRELLGDYPLYIDINLPFIDELLEDYITAEANIPKKEEIKDSKDTLYSIYEMLIK